MRNITTKTGIIRSLKYFYHEVQEQNQIQEVTDVFDVVPTTFIVNTQYKTADMYRFIKRFSDLASNEGLSLKEHMPSKHCTKNMWLLKPATLNQGRGIQIFSKIKDIFDHIDSQAHQNSYWVIQKYIERPLLFQQRKFDIRMWVLVTIGQNGTDTDIHMYREGYLRTSSSAYDLQDENRYVHLTNNCLQQKGFQYGQHEDGNTLSFKTFQEYLTKEYKDLDVNIERDFIPRMRDIIIDTIQSIKGDMNPSRRKNQFQLLGYDFLIDEDFRMWLLEVNNNPYLGIPNEFIQNLLPQMIRDMFKIVIPGSSFQDQSQKNGFQLIQSDSQDISLRRFYGLDLLYPIQQCKQVIGKEKKNSILKHRKDRYNLKQSLLQQQYQDKMTKYTINIQNDQNSRVTLNIGTLSSKKDVQISTPKDFHSQISTGIVSSRAQLISSKNSIQDDYKEIHRMAMQNQQVQNKINNRSPQISSQIILQQDTSVQVLNQPVPQQINFKPNNFKKDLLEETKAICLKKDCQVTQNQFEYLLNKILNKIQQWDLFDDKQIKKYLEAYDVMCNSKAVVHFQNTLILDKLVKIIENDQIPQNYRIPIFELLEVKAKLLSQLVWFVENKSLISMLQYFIKNYFENQEEEQLEKLSDISFRILLMCLQMEQNPNRAYIPKLTKEKQNLKYKSIENGILLYLIKIYLSKNLQYELQNLIMSKLSIRDLQTQMNFIQSSDTFTQYKVEFDYIKGLHDKIKNENEINFQREQQVKQKQIEDERIFKIKLEEDREQKRKIAEDMFTKRLEEKKRFYAEEKKKLALDQQEIERVIEQNKKQKLLKITERNNLRNFCQSNKKPRLDQSLINEPLRQSSKIKSIKNESNMENLNDDDQAIPRDNTPKITRKIKLNNSLKREVVDIHNLMDNLIIFNQQKIQKQTDDASVSSTYQLRTYSNFRTSIQDQCVSKNPKLGLKESYNMLQNLKHIKDSKLQEDQTELSQVFKNDYMIQTFSNLDKKKMVNKVSEKKKSSFTQIIQNSEGKKKPNMMVLPSLDYEVIYNRSYNYKGSILGIESNKNHSLIRNLNDGSQTANNIYFKHRAHSKVQNLIMADNNPHSTISKANNARRKLSPLNERQLSQINQSPRFRLDMESDKTSKNISEIILLMLNQRKPQEIKKHQ